MSSPLVLLDTNVLLRWINRDTSEHELATLSTRSLGQQGFILCYTSQNLGEFWNVLTRPVTKNGFGENTVADSVKANEIERNCRLLCDTPSVHYRWRTLLTRYRISGVQVHDARLVAIMQVHGVRHILTFNTKDFTRFEAIESMHPSQLA